MDHATTARASLDYCVLAVAESKDASEWRGSASICDGEGQILVHGCGGWGSGERGDE